MKWLDHLEEWLITAFMGLATTIIFLSVVHRYLTGVHTPIQDWLLSIDMSWAQEATIYLFVWMAKFGAAYGVRQGTHVGVDVLVNRLSPGKRKWFILFSLFAGALFTGIVGTLGARFVWDNGFHYALFHGMGLPLGDVPEGPTSPDLEIHTWIAYSCVPLGSYLMCFRFIQVAWHFIQTGQVPHHDHGHVDGIDDDALSALDTDKGAKA